MLYFIGQKCSRLIRLPFSYKTEKGGLKCISEVSFCLSNFLAEGADNDFGASVTAGHVASPP